MTVWVIRAGRHGEREQWCLAHRAAGGGWDEVGDLASCESRDDVRALVDQAYPTESNGKLANWAGQLWALRNVAVGDIIILPLKSSPSIAIGTCDGGYRYEPGDEIRHQVSVHWERDDVPRSAIKDDLLFTLGAIMTIFKASRNNAERRFRAVLETGVDPGSLAVEAPFGKASSAVIATDDAVTDPVPVPTLETIRDRVRTHVAENFKGHRLTELVADILRARGFVCDVSPPGADQGVDTWPAQDRSGVESSRVVYDDPGECVLLT